MKINPNVEIEDMNGTPIPKEVDSKESFRLKDALINALYAQFEDEKGLIGEKKIERYTLAEKIWKATGEVDLKAEDITLLKTLVGKAYGVLIVGRVYELIDPVSTEGAELKLVKKPGKK